MIDKTAPIFYTRLGTLLILASLPATAACFSEQSFSITAADIVHVAPGTTPSPTSTRQWLARTHQALSPLLPFGETSPS